MVSESDMERGSVPDTERSKGDFKAAAAAGNAWIGSVGEAPSLGDCGMKAAGRRRVCASSCAGAVLRCLHEERGVAARSGEAASRIWICMFFAGIGLEVARIVDSEAGSDSGAQKSTVDP
jgi:hypothetical protein